MSERQDTLINTLNNEIVELNFEISGLKHEINKLKLENDRLRKLLDKIIHKCAKTLEYMVVKC